MTKTGNKIFSIFSIFSVLFIITAFLAVNISFLSNIYSKEDFIVKTRLKSKVVGIEDDFSYSLIIKTSKKVLSKVEKPVWPKNIEFSYLSNSEQTSIQIHNANVSKSVIKTISYSLKAKKLGWIILPSIKVFANNKVYKTKKVKIKVVKESQAQRHSNNRQFSPIDSFFNNRFPFKRDKKKFNKQDVFIKLELNKNKFFLSEQIILKWFLYTRLNISGVELNSLPELKYFWKKNLDNQSRSRQQVSINNKIYQKSLLFSYIASPLKTGQLNIDPLKVKIQTFDMAGFGLSSSGVDLESKNKIISVVNLPKLEKNFTFLGAVGDFQLKDSVKTDKIQQGKAFIWEVVIQGLGNVEVFNFDNFKLGKNLELYDVQENIEIFSSGVSKKKLELLVIPKKAGKINLPIIKFTAFNPHTKSYYSLLSTKKTILVNKNPLYLKSATTQSATTQSAAKSYIKPDKKIQNKKLNTDSITGKFIDKIYQINKKEKKNLFIYIKYFIFLFISALLCFLFFIIFKKIQNKEKDNLLILKDKFLKIENNILPTDTKKAARALIDLTYWAVSKAKDKKYNFLSLNKMLNQLPLSYQDKHVADLKRILQICETIAFSKKVPVGLEKQLKKISIELHSYLKILLKYN